MTGKKTKKSKEDLIQSSLDDLADSDPASILGTPLTFEQTRSVANALINPEGEALHEDNELPLGFEGFSSSESVSVPEVSPFDSLLSDKPRAVPLAEPEEEVTRVVRTSAVKAPSPSPAPTDDRTSVLPAATEMIVASDLSEKTVFVRADGGRPEPIEEKISFGVARPSTKSPGSQAAAWGDAQINQAENLRIAQERMLELEHELEKLRAENETMSSAHAQAEEQIAELTQKALKFEADIAANSAQFELELEIHRDGGQAKDAEIIRLRGRVDELESRLQQDLRKIRVRERELENRLELTKMEKDSLLRSKDEAMLDLKRNMDQLTYELQGYRQRVTDLNQRIESNTEQFSRTVRALRLALTNLEVSDTSGSMTITPLKKAE